jgi:hypothetical protein
VKVRFHKIENMVSRPTRLFDQPAVRHDCDVSFSTSAVAGDAFLRIHEPLRARECPQVVLNRDVELWGSYLEGETEVTDLGSTDAVPESVRPLGPRGHFEMIAHFERYERISLMPPPADAGLSACDFYFPVLVENFPPGTLEIDSGNLVRIRTQKLVFDAIGTVSKEPDEGRKRFRRIVARIYPQWASRR